MRNILRNKKGFTLVELIVVIIIIGVLAAVATPMMTANIDRAKRTEAVAAMGAIRTAERMVKSETSNYESITNGNWSSTNLNKYFTAGDLNGKNYNDGNYSVDTGANLISASGSTTLVCNMNLNTGVIKEP